MFPHFASLNDTSAILAALCPHLRKAWRAFFYHFGRVIDVKRGRRVLPRPPAPLNGLLAVHSCRHDDSIPRGRTAAAANPEMR